MPYLFVSDLHLDAGTRAANDQFVALLEGPARAARAIYVLGDLFESSVGDDDLDAEKLRICGALRALSEAHVRCFVMHGNRDFLLGGQFARLAGCEILPDPVLAELDDEALLLSHGDMFCTDDGSYQELRSTVRDAAWQRSFLALSLSDRKLLAAAARAGSRAHMAAHLGGERAAIMDVNLDAVEKLLRATAVSTMIHGHTHRPAVHEHRIDGRRVQRIVLDSWYEHGQYLWWHRGRFESRTLAR